MPRSDLKDVIIDTYREGRAWTRDSRRVGDRDLDATHGSMRDYFHRKYFGDRLAPLRRWLRRQVGRPWGKVFSELCADADRRCIRGHHLREHTEQMVEMHAVRQADGTYRRGHDSWQGELRHDDLFVDERGILRVPKQPKRRRSPRRREPRVNKVHRDGAIHVRCSGSWWSVEPMTDREQIAVARSADAKVFVWRSEQQGFELVRWQTKPRNWNALEQRGLLIYPAAKRQLGRAEEKRLGLRRPR